jgi:hypothetical protein
MTGVGIPIVIGADEARHAAQQELSKRIYHSEDEPWLLRALNAVLRWIGHLVDRAAGASPGGATGLVLIVATLVVIAIAFRLGLGPLARSARFVNEIAEDKRLSADDYRARADELAGHGDYAGAVRERFRAIVRELEHRGVLDGRPGRTANEVAVEAGKILTALRADLLTAARLFDDVTYGGRAATAGADAGLRSLDQYVRTARLTTPA